MKIIPQEEKQYLKEVYTDGSYNEKTNKGAFSILVKNLDGSYEETAQPSNSQSSSLIELEAVIYALTHYEGDLRIVTDSQYVIKGITQWIIYWKRNNWMTANGTKAKNVGQWQKLDHLCQNRYIEFMWVKGHSQHFENDYCDLIARNETMK